MVTSRSLQLLGSYTRFRADQAIYRQGDPVACRYHMVSGAARRFVINPNGRRQIIEFLFPGDFFGFTSRERHAFGVEAARNDTTIERFPCARIEALIETEPSVGRLMRQLAGGEIQRLQAHVLLLGHIKSTDKVAAFLLEMAERSSAGPGRFALPMSRYDIADYLALSVETVSRALTALKHNGWIALTGTRRVQILDRTALHNGEEIDGPA